MSPPYGSPAAELCPAPDLVGFGVTEGLDAPPPIADLLAQLGNTAIMPPEHNTAPDLYALEGPDVPAAAEQDKGVDRQKEVFRLTRNSDTYEVTVESDLTLEDWEHITPKEDWDLMLDYADYVKETAEGKPVVFINPTMEGGGVAMMRPPLIHMLRQLGVDARWYVMEGPKPDEPNPFLFTKQMHNTIQRRLPPDVRITEEGKAIHQKWAYDNADVLEQQDTIKNAAIIELDDPQPAPLLRRLRGVNPDVKIVWRNHIDNDGELMMDPATPQGEIWEYLRDECGIGEVNAAIFHPDINNAFVPADIAHKTFLAPASIEPHDDMNRELNAEEKQQGIASINAQIIRGNEQAIKEGRFDDVQELIDIDRDRLVLIARFDESKGMDLMMDFGALIRQKVLDKRAAAGIVDAEPVQTVIIGNGSGDDPSGPPMLEQMRQQRREKYSDVKKDIILERLQHNYVAMNAMMYNDSEDVVLIAAQTSLAEGCETRISDWEDHGIPVVVANIGGMPLQVIEGRSGILLDYKQPDFDLGRGADIVSDLIVYPARYRDLRKSTQEASKSHNKREYTTTANVTRQLRVFNSVLTGKKADKTWKIDEMVRAKALESQPHFEETERIAA